MSSLRLAKLPASAFTSDQVTVENVDEHLAPILEFFIAPASEPPSAAAR
jgi:hypothetical protein